MLPVEETGEEDVDIIWRQASCESVGGGGAGTGRRGTVTVNGTLRKIKSMKK